MKIVLASVIERRSVFIYDLLSQSQSYISSFSEVYSQPDITTCLDKPSFDRNSQSYCLNTTVAREEIVESYNGMGNGSSTLTTVATTTYTMPISNQLIESASTNGSALGQFSNQQPVTSSQQHVMNNEYLLTNNE